MATRSSILAWKIPWTEEPGWLQSTGSHIVGHFLWILTALYVRKTEVVNHLFLHLADVMLQFACFFKNSGTCVCVCVGVYVRVCVFCLEKFS